MSAAILILCIIIMLLGLAGTILPVLPGIPVMWLAMLGYGWYSGWIYYGPTAMIVTGLVVALSLIVDQLASVLGAKKFGATKAGMIGSVVGAILGAIVSTGLGLTILGLVLGTFLGAVVFEMVFSRQDLKKSLSSGTGALLGFLAGSLFKFMVGLSFIVYFIFARLYPVIFS